MSYHASAVIAAEVAVFSLFASVVCRELSRLAAHLGDLVGTTLAAFVTIGCVTGDAGGEVVAHLLGVLLLPRGHARGWGEAIV